MEKLRPLRQLLVAIPAFALGGLVTASLTGTARAQGEMERARELGLSLKEIQQRQTKAKPIYHIVTDEGTMNKYAEQGYAVESVSSTANFTNYLMRRVR